MLRIDQLPFLITIRLSSTISDLISAIFFSVAGSLVCKLILRVLVVCFKAIIRAYRCNGFNNHVLKRLRKVYSAPVQIVTGHVISPLFTLSSI